MGRYRGNIDLSTRPPVVNPDGTVSTVRSIGVNIDGKETLIPTVVNGRVVSNDEAIEHYRQTGEHLGQYRTVRAADRAAERIHKQEARRVDEVQDHHIKRR